MTKPIREKPTRGYADLRRLRQPKSDEEINRTSPPELANLPADFWDSAVMVYPVRKEAISLRVDEDILAWFRKGGPGYQSRMNAVLRSYVEANRTQRSRRKGGKRAS